MNKNIIFAYSIPRVNYQANITKINLNNPEPDQLTRLYQFVAINFSEAKQKELKQSLLRASYDPDHSRAAVLLQLNNVITLNQLLTIFKEHKEAILSLMLHEDKKYEQETDEATVEAIYDRTCKALGLVAKDILISREPLPKSKSQNREQAVKNLVNYLMADPELVNSDCMRELVDYAISHRPDLQEALKNSEYFTAARQSVKLEDIK